MMAQGIERFSAPPPGEEFDATDEARFRRLIEQFMENADYRVRDLGGDVESVDTTVTDHESRITTLEGLGGLRVIDSGAATVSGSGSSVVTSDPAIGSGSIGVCIVAKDFGGGSGRIEQTSRFYLHNSDESTTLSMGLSAGSSTTDMDFGASLVLHGQHAGTPHHYDIEIVEGTGSALDVQYVIAELIV